MKIYPLHICQLLATGKARLFYQYVGFSVEYNKVIQFLSVVFVVYNRRSCGVVGNDTFVVLELLLCDAVHETIVVNMRFRCKSKIQANASYSCFAFFGLFSYCEQSTSSLQLNSPSFKFS